MGAYRHVPYVNFSEEFAQNREPILNAITAVLEKGDFILGQQVTLFEKEFAELSQVRHAISVANGTDAIILALKVLGIGSGDEVITAANSWISTAAAIALIGATPVFADVDDDQNICPESIASKMTSKTKAILPVHLTGRCADMPAILEVARRQGVPVIEDAAQAVTASVHGITAGGAGIIGCFSLHPLKNLNAVGDAGIMTTNDDEIAEKLRLMRQHGLKNRDEVVFFGYNSRLDTIQAAVLRTRLPKLAGYLARRRANAKRYTDALSGIVRCPEDTDGRPHTYHVYVIQTDRRDEMQTFLAERGIETKIHYPIPIHFQEAAHYLNYKPGSLPKTELQAKRILSLPIHPYLSQDQIDWVIESVSEFALKNRLVRSEEAHAPELSL